MSKRKALAVETVSIDSLTAHPRNYRGHPDAQVAEIGKSLDAFGQYKPVVVSSDGVILAGHGVWMAAQAAGHLVEAKAVLTRQGLNPIAGLVVDKAVAGQRARDGTG